MTDALTTALAAAWQSAELDTRGQVLPAADWLSAVPDSTSAYAVQDALATRLGWAQAGRPAQFWKSGGASREAEISHAPLAPAGVRVSSGGATVSFQDMRRPMPIVEAEIALRLGVDISPAQAAVLSPDQALELIDAYAIAAELVASRWQEGSAAPALLRQADCLSHGALALGPWRPCTVASLPDWSVQNCWMQRNDEPAICNHGRHPLADPAWLLPAWLRHLSRWGATVPAGTVVTTGAWLLLRDLRPGDHVHLGFEGLGELAVRL